MSPEGEAEPGEARARPPGRVDLTFPPAPRDTRPTARGATGPGLRDRGWGARAHAVPRPRRTPAREYAAPQTPAGEPAPDRPDPPAPPHKPASLQKGRGSQRLHRAGRAARGPGRACTRSAWRSENASKGRAGKRAPDGKTRDDPRPGRRHLRRGGCMCACARASAVTRVSAAAHARACVHSPAQGRSGRAADQGAEARGSGRWTRRGSTGSSARKQREKNRDFAWEGGEEPDFQKGTKEPGACAAGLWDPRGRAPSAASLPRCGPAARGAGRARPSGVRGSRSAPLRDALVLRVVLGPRCTRRLPGPGIQRAAGPPPGQDGRSHSLPLGSQGSACTRRPGTETPDLRRSCCFQGTASPRALPPHQRSGPMSAGTRRGGAVSPCGEDAASPGPPR